MMNLKIQLSAFDPPPEFFFSYDRILVSFSGGEGSLAAVLSLIDSKVPPQSIELLYRHDEGRNIQGIPIGEEYCELVAGLLGVRVTPLPAVSRKEVSLLKYIVRNRKFLNSSTLVVSGERRIDHPNRERLMQFENDTADNRFAGKHKRRLRYVDRYRPILHWDEERTRNIIDQFGIIDFLYGEKPIMLATTDSIPISLETLAMDDLARQAEELAARSKGAGTLRAYDSAWRGYLRWCEDNGVDYRTANSYTVANYVTARSRDLSASSIKVMRAAIKDGYENLDIPVDMNAPFLRRVVSGALRQIGTRPTRKVTAATPDVIRSMLAAGPGPDEAAGARNKAMFLVGFGAALRRSEIVALLISDVEVSHRGLRVLIRKSKTDKLGAGKEIGVAANPVDPDFCPVVAVHQWLKHRLTVPAGPDDALFCGLSTHGGRVTGEPLTDQTVMRALKQAARAAGMEPETVSGHSLRRGFMTAAAASGASLHHMMRHSRHRSTAVALGYIEEAGMWDDNVSELIFSGEKP